ncbi:hypothetical protein [Flavobacterium gilvum]|uniref:Uncharacterized protein n=1 Tax=Flavobacterium gilvum TaxID=1492737 RepID=A0AAC9I1D0_9FLAO|nr:hypothetical protein [Flavobacterium gilvum]AOW08559.1 hypothetical protein EM308_03065 [Flavobacterium gilvum]KFC58808.1 hypothetical protein FEM08_24060 [Flavobacterium gilvum]
MGKDDGNERGRLTAEQAVKILKKENLDVTLDQAGSILEFLRKLAGLTVSNYLMKSNEGQKPRLISKRRKHEKKQIK